LILGEQHKILTDTYNLMKLENYRFPPLKEGEAMFENNDIPPEWRDDKVCFRCRQTFTTFIRKVNRNERKYLFFEFLSFSSIIVEHVEIFFVINVKLINLECKIIIYLFQFRFIEILSYSKIWYRS